VGGEDSKKGSAAARPFLVKDKKGSPVKGFSDNSGSNAHHTGVKEKMRLEEKELKRLKIGQKKGKRMPDRREKPGVKNGARRPTIKNAHKERENRYARSLEIGQSRPQSKETARGK